MNDLVDALKVVLGTAFVLYLKMHGAHWNVEGPYFPQLHKLFERIYEDVWESVDPIAEKLRQIDVHVPASMEAMASSSRLQGFSGPLHAQAMVMTLMQDHQTMVDVLNEAITAAHGVAEEGIISFLAERVEAHQKWRWFLRATAKTV